MRPLLFLDIDGTLLPFGPVTLATNKTSNPLLAKLDPRHGPRLLSLPCDLVWATTWMGEANEVIAPLLGLPALPVADFPEDAVPRGLHWKTRPLVELAAGRAFAWVDDEITDFDQEWVSAHHPGRALLLRVDASTGLTDPNYAELDSWLRTR